MPSYLKEYFEFNPTIEAAEEEVGPTLECILTDLHMEGAMVRLHFVDRRAIRVKFSTVSEHILAETEVIDVESAMRWLFDQGVRYYPGFAQQHAIWMGAEYAPASPRMRTYGCTCPNTPNANETGTYRIYLKCRIHGLT